MSTENSPLLGDTTAETAAILDHEAVYSNFPQHRKRIIVALVSWSALLPMFASGTFIPSIPDIAADLNSSPEVISLAVSLSILSGSIGSLVCATYSTYYGRRIAYLTGTPFIFLGSMGVCYSRNVSEMLAFRCVQALGTSGGMSVGAAVIGDIYKLTERGQAMGLFFGASLLGPALAPVAGGWGAHYASWRWTQFCLGIAGLFTFILLYTLLPETSHPGSRGLDKDIEKHGENAKKWVWLNPFGGFYLLRSPNLFLTSIAGTVVLCTDFCLMMPIAYTIGERYNITNAMYIGACFIPVGLGNIIGAPLAGYLADRVMTESIEKYGRTVWRPEERLKAALFGSLIPVPLSIFFSGLITQFIPGTLGLVLNLVCFFINGIGVDLALTPMSAYFVDIMRDRSAEVLASTVAFRGILLSVAIPLTIPSILRFGVAITDGIAAGVAFIGYIILLLVIRKGQAMRDYVDVGFTKLDRA